MKGIKWFQRIMIVFLISINALVYWIQSAYKASTPLFLMLLLIGIPAVCFLLLMQSRKRRTNARMAVVKKQKI